MSADDALPDKHGAIRSLDAISGLPDKIQYLKETMERCRISLEDSTPFVLAIVEIRGTDDVIPVFGPKIWSEVVGAIAERLVNALPNNTEVYHTQTTQFSVVLQSGDFQEAVEFARKVIDGLDDPYSVDGLPITFATRVGLARFPNHSDEVDELSRCALVALKECRQNGEDFAVYDPAWDTAQRGRYMLLQDLKDALRRKEELLLHFQPTVDLATGRCYGVEGLIRWQHPVHGLVPPASFVPACEETSLIQDLTDRVVAMGLEQLVRWQLEGRDVSVALNLSARDLADRAITERIGNIIRFYGSQPANIVFEVTETAVMENPRLSAENIRRLKSIGVGVSIDDFGVGHSSLAYLSQLPCDALKIDRSFIANIGSEPRIGSIVRAAISLAHDLGMRAIAEGVEHEETVDTLRNWGCDAAQGYLFAKPSENPPLDLVYALGKPQKPVRRRKTKSRSKSKD